MTRGLEDSAQPGHGVEQRSSHVAARLQVVPHHLRSLLRNLCLVVSIFTCQLSSSTATADSRCGNVPGLKYVGTYVDCACSNSLQKKKRVLSRSWPSCDVECLSWSAPPVMWSSKFLWPRNKCNYQSSKDPSCQWFCDNCLNEDNHTWYIGWLFEVVKRIALVAIPGSQAYNDLVSCTGSVGLTGLNWAVALAGANSISEFVQQLMDKNGLSALSLISYELCRYKDCYVKLGGVAGMALDQACNFGTFAVKQMRCATEGLLCESNAWGREAVPVCAGLKASMVAQDIPYSRGNCSDCCGAQANHVLGCNHPRNTVTGPSNSKCRRNFEGCMAACEDLSQGACLPQCSDLLDNDGDGFADTNDYACRLKGPNHNDESSPKAQCENGEDDDEDGKTDNGDPGCIHPSSGQYHPYLNSEKADSPCSDGTDNDYDGFIDELDYACAHGGSREDEPKAQCENGKDDDKDGRADRGDSDCIHPSSGKYHPYLDTEKADNQCTDGRDNDGDGFKDGADYSCAHGGSGESEFRAQCQNDKDDDNDGMTDKEDPGCIHPSNGEYHPYLDNERADNQCTDGKDNDGDGGTDQLDYSCSQGGSREDWPKAECEDGQDNDNDKKTDAADPDCKDSRNQTYMRFGKESTCTPRCGSRKCGFDGCGGYCGLCRPNEEYCDSATWQCRES